MNDVLVHFSDCRNKASDTGIGSCPTDTSEAITNFLSLRRTDGVVGGTTCDLLRWNGTAYTILRKSVELYEAICYLEYVRLNGSEFHASEIEAFNIDTVMAD